MFGGGSEQAEDLWDNPDQEKGTRLQRRQIRSVSKEAPINGLSKIRDHSAFAIRPGEGKTLQVYCTAHELESVAGNCVEGL